MKRRREFYQIRVLGLTGMGLSSSVFGMDKENKPLLVDDDNLALNYHLMHPGGYLNYETRMLLFPWTALVIYTTSFATPGRRR